MVPFILCCYTVQYTPIKSKWHCRPSTPHPPSQTSITLVLLSRTIHSATPQKLPGKCDKELVLKITIHGGPIMNQTWLLSVWTWDIYTWALGVVPAVSSDRTLVIDRTRGGLSLACPIKLGSGEFGGKIEPLSSFSSKPLRCSVLLFYDVCSWVPLDNSECWLYSLSPVLVSNCHHNSVSALAPCCIYDPIKNSYSYTVTLLLLWFHLRRHTCLVRCLYKLFVTGSKFYILRNWFSVNLCLWPQWHIHFLSFTRIMTFAYLKVLQKYFFVLFTVLCPCSCQGLFRAVFVVWQSVLLRD